MVSRYLRESYSEAKVNRAIQPGDVRNLSKYFDKSTPPILQEEVGFV